MKVFIQNEAGSFMKHYHNEKTLELLGATQVSRAYPFPYGFVLGTAADDGLSVDCFLLTKRHLKPGQIVECGPVGLMEQFEDGKEDHNVLAVLRDEAYPICDQTKITLTDFVIHVFDHVPGKSITVGEFRDRQAAEEFILRHRDAISEGETPPVL